MASCPWRKGLARFGSPLRTYTTSGSKERNMKPTAPKLIRWAGLSAMAAGIIFLVILPIQPPAVLSSVTTPAWAIVQSAEVAMCLLGLIGLTGLYARQANEAGLLGLAGYLLFSLFYALTLPFVFAQAFILPHLATTAPAFVESWLGIINPESPVEMNLGGLLFGIATFRAGVLPRWAAGLLAVSGPLGPVAVALLPPALERYVGLPLGLALGWLGY